MNPYAIPTSIQLTNVIERPQPTKILTKLRVIVDNVELNNGANVRSQLLTDNEDYVEEKKFYITGHDYVNWTEDNYLINWVKKQLDIVDPPAILPDVSGNVITNFIGHISDASESVVTDASESVVTDASESVVTDASENVVTDVSENVVTDVSENVVTDASENVVTDASDNSS